MPAHSVGIVGRGLRPALVRGHLYRGRVPLGAEHARDPRVAQAAQAPHVEVQGLVRGLQHGEQRGLPALADHGELQALGLHALAELLPPHEAGPQEAHSRLGDLGARVAAGEAPPRGTAHLHREFRHRLGPRLVGSASVARVRADSHDLVAEQRASQGDPLDVEPARPHAIGVHTGAQLERLRVLLAVGHPEQRAARRRHADVEAVALQVGHVRVVEYNHRGDWCWYNHRWQWCWVDRWSACGKEKCWSGCRCGGWCGCWCRCWCGCRCGCRCGGWWCGWCRCW
mmetsp:Transcript_61914/g.164628  ORF Transcript_61914/g.164628 Transcript_61914/m.164628 type:complete len:284 (+) Transcript_61914:281-1132(+)